jgi:pyruvate dehydrogenase E2 component (dihydrolipoamide acetyltransferase)
MATPIIMPRLGDFMTEGTITKWRKSSGESVRQGEVIAEIETEKVNYDLEATVSGKLHTLVEDGTIVPVDDVAGYLLEEGEEAPPQVAEVAPKVSQRRESKSRRDEKVVSAGGAPVKSTPGARRLASKLGVDISQVSPTGPGGRVVEDDVRAASESGGSTNDEQLPPVGLPTPTETVPVTGIRKIVAEHMLRSISSTAQLSFFLEVDVTDIQRLRKEKSNEVETTLTIGHVLTKACAEALKRNPLLNTVLSGGNIYHFDSVNIGVAVALEDGLIVPVVRDAGIKSVFDVASDTDALVDRAREGQLSPDEVVGGTFTISVLGSVDGFTPILSSGQSAILGVGRSVEKPVVKKGEIVVREMMQLSLTVDHQVIDGAVAASFFRRLQQLVERPGNLFK